MKKITYTTDVAHCGGERWTSLAAYVRFEEYAHWYDQQGFDIHDVTHWQKIVLPKKEKE